MNAKQFYLATGNIASLRHPHFWENMSNPIYSKICPRPEKRAQGAYPRQEHGIRRAWIQVKICLVVFQIHQFRNFIDIHA